MGKIHEMNEHLSLTKITEHAYGTASKCQATFLPIAIIYSEQHLW